MGRLTDSILSRHRQRKQEREQPTSSAAPSGSSVSPTSSSSSSGGSRGSGGSNRFIDSTVPLASIPVEGGNPIARAQGLPQPGAAPAPNMFGAMSIRGSTADERRSSNRLTNFVSSAVRGFSGQTAEPGGRDLQTLSPTTTLGYLAGVVGSQGLGKALGKIGGRAATTRTASKAGNDFLHYTIGGHTGQIGTGATANTFTQGVVNQAAGKVAGSSTWKTISALGLSGLVAKEIIEKSVGGKVFGDFVGSEEASQTVNIAARDALMSGDFESYEEAAQARDEVLESPDFWENIRSYLPYVNVGDALEKYRKAAVTAAGVYDKLAERKRQAAEGMSEDEIQASEKQEREDQEKAMIDYYNEQRKLMFDYEQQARAAAAIAKRAADKKARNEDARFWAAQAAKQREAEEADRQAIADFWSQYRREQYKFQQDTKPSNLKFGLL